MRTVRGDRWVPLVAGVLAAGCNGANTTSTDGLMLIVNTDLAPAEFDAVRVQVRQGQGADAGSWSERLDMTKSVPGEVRLPTTVLIEAGTSPDQTALIDVAALLHGEAVVLREVEVTVPTRRLAELRLWLSEACKGQVRATGAEGDPQPACATPGQSCQPDTGMCGDRAVSSDGLPSYTPGDEDRDAAAPIADGAAEGASLPDAGGDSAATCNPDPVCAAPGTACVDPSTQVTCERDARGCLVESATSSCTGGATCQGSGCACPSGTHACSGVCVANTAVATCGATGCSPCPAPANGTATCDGTACGVSCNAGLNPCHGACVDELSDPANCGACARSCQGGACSAGVCLPSTLATGQRMPLAMTIDATSVYWVDEGTSANGFDDGAVMAVPLSGGSAPTVLASGQANPQGIAVDGANVYWTNTGTSGTFPDSVAKAALGGGTPQVITSEGTPGALAVDGTNVYFGDEMEVASPPPLILTRLVFSIQVAPTSTTMPTPAMTFLQFGGSNSPTVVASAVWIALDAQNVYWTDSANVFSLAKADPGGTPATLATGQNDVAVLVVDATNAYWASGGTSANNFADGAVMKVPIAGGATPTPLATAQNHPDAIAVDGTYAYWANLGSGAGTGSVMRAPIAGGPATTLASGQNAPTSIAVDATFVYWLNQGTSAANFLDGAVMKLAKP